jgi:signal transduction histidine kinase
MRRGGWAWCATEAAGPVQQTPAGFGLAFVRLLLLAALGWACTARAAEPVNVRSVQMAQVFGPETPAQAQRAAVPPAVDGAWREQALPLRRFVPPSRRVVPSGVRSETVLLRFALPPALDRDPAGPAIYVPRIDGLGEIAVHMDGRNVFAAVDVQDVGHFNRPLAVLLPPQPADRASDAPPREVVVTLAGPPHFSHRLSTLWVAPREQATGWQRVRSFVQADGPRVLAGGLLLLGLFSLVVWWRRRRERQFLWFFVLTLLFFVRCWHYHAMWPPWIGRWWAEWFTTQSLGGICVCTVLFARAFHGREQRRGVQILVAAASAAALHALPPVWNLLTPQWPPAIVYGPLAAVCLASVLLLAHAAWRTGSRSAWALASVLALNLVLGVHDLGMLVGWVDIEHVYVLPLGGLAMFSVFIALVARQHGRALERAADAQADLERRLAEREAELRGSLETLQREREQRMLADERQRLMREMHDGLGSALTSSLVAVQRGQASPELLQGLLGDAVDELRLTLDSLEPVEGDLLLLLATARWRLQPRLEAAGLTLHWQAGELPPVAWLTPQLGLHLLRILQELLANVVRHAQARHVTIAASRRGDTVDICVSDDGRGFDPARASAGRGRANVARRAAALGAVLQWESAPGRGTRVWLHLPLAGPAVAPAADAAPASGPPLPAPGSKPS